MKESQVVSKSATAQTGDSLGAARPAQLETVELRHVTSPDADCFSTIYTDRRVSYRELGVHYIIASAADSGDDAAGAMVLQREVDDDDFCDAVDTLEHYGYLVRGSKAAQAGRPPAGKWVLFDTANIPAVISQREALEAQGYEVIEPFGRPRRAAEEE